MNLSTPHIADLRDAASLLAWLGSAGAQAAILTVAIFALRAALGPRLSPGWRGALWLIVGLRLLVPLTLDSRWSLPAIGREVVAQVVPPPAPQVRPPTVTIRYGTAPTPASPAAFVARSTPRWPRAAIVVWLGGVGFFALRQIVAGSRLRRAVTRMRPIDDVATLQLSARCAAELGVRRRVRLVEADRLRSPAVCGIAWPTILLPPRVRDALPDDALRLVLLHEFAHVRRGDALVAALVGLVRAMHWFNPFVWLAASAFRADRELACDAAVLARLADPRERRAYGECVIRVIAHVSGLPTHAASLGLFGSARSLRRRIDMIADRSDRPSFSSRSIRLMLGAAAFAAIGCAALAGEPTSSPATKSGVDALMSRRIDTAHFSGTPLAEALNDVAMRADATLRIDWDSLGKAGVTRQTPVTVSLANVALGKTLERMFEQTKTAIDFEAEGETIVVSTADAIAAKYSVERTYDLGAILPAADGNRKAMADQIVTLIADTVDTNSWTTNGGKAGTTEVRGTQLIVRQTPRRHAKIAALLREMAPRPDAAPTSAPAAPPSAEARGKATLDAPVGFELTLNAKPFGRVVDELRDRTGASIFVNWTALEGAGVGRDAAVTFQLPADVKLSKVLSILLDAAGGGVARLGYKLDEGVITISTRDDLAKNVETRTYDVRDLLVRIPDFDPATTTQPTPESREAMVQQLVDLIQNTVEADTWKSNGGLIGAIQELGGQLILTTEPKTQEQILTLLKQLREGRAIQISVEARFMLVDVAQLPPAFNRMLREAKPADATATASIFLDDAQLKA